MDKIYQLVGRVRRFIEAHWRMVLVTLSMIVVLQQCTINRLRWEVEQMATRPSVIMSHADSAAIADAKPNVVAAPDTAVPDSLSLHVPTEADTVREAVERSVPWVLIVIGVVLLGVGIYIFIAVRNAVFPFGVSFRSKLRKPGQGQVAFYVKVSNRSPKSVEVTSAQVNFVMGVGQVRRFRANIPSLPITLQPHTSFDSQINLTGLIGANLELFQAKAISMSLVVSGKTHTTLPHAVAFRQG
ncbi:MAG: hypothetical protein MR215_05055 [Bacteroidales bacterium]|nr:hypothetical protein [Bacteroidales bacterium]MDY4174082.1 hypothetical protein [Bacteroidales bacterium]